MLRLLVQYELDLLKPEETQTAHFVQRQFRSHLMELDDDTTVRAIAYVPRDDVERLPPICITIPSQEEYRVTGDRRQG